MAKAPVNPFLNSQTPRTRSFEMNLSSFHVTTRTSWSGTGRNSSGDNGDLETGATVVVVGTGAVAVKPVEEAPEMAQIRLMLPEMH